VFVYLCASPPTLGQVRPHGSDVPSRPVNSFGIRDLNMIDGLLQLGQEQQVPIGIEYIDAAAFSSRMTLHTRNSTVGSLLNTITHGQGYRWFIQDGVVMVTHHGEPEGRKNLLNTRIPEFAIDKEITLQAASVKLLGALYWVLNPHSGAQHFPATTLAYQSPDSLIVCFCVAKSTYTKPLDQHEAGGYVLRTLSALAFGFGVRHGGRRLRFHRLRESSDQ